MQLNGQKIYPMNCLKIQSFIDIERVDENIRNINIKGDERFADAGN